MKVPPYRLISHNQNTSSFTAASKGHKHWMYTTNTTTTFTTSEATSTGHNSRINCHCSQPPAVPDDWTKGLHMDNKPTDYTTQVQHTTEIFHHLRILYLKYILHTTHKTMVTMPINFNSHQV
jgi:hypothetical protein